MDKNLDRGSIGKYGEILSRVSEIKKDFGEAKTENKVSCIEIISALEQFTECVRYLNTRRSTGAKLVLESESDVQDALYLMLRPWILDLSYENPIDKVGNRFVIKDFISKSAQTVVEAKYIRDTSHGKQISKELHDDIEMYRHHPNCENLIFFIYDPDSLIPDVASLTREIKTRRVYDGRELKCYLVVKP
jgi:hypothetical protein